GRESFAVDLKLRKPYLIDCCPCSRVSSPPNRKNPVPVPDSTTTVARPAEGAAVTPAPVLHVTMGTHDPAGSRDADPRIGRVDLYRLPDTDLTAVRGLIVGGGADQIFLERNRNLLTDFVTSGGRVAVMGHVLADILPGLGVWRKIDYTGPKDLAITLGDPHPVWEGV